MKLAIEIAMNIIEYFKLHPEIDGAKEYIACEEAHERSIQRQLDARAFAKAIIAKAESSDARIEVIAAN